MVRASRRTHARGGYYDREAPRYDDSRGGAARAVAAAHAVRRLAPRARSCLDVGGGTGSVGEQLASAGLGVVVLDASHGMLRVASERLPGRAVRAEATCLPLTNSSVDLVTMVWLLHLLGRHEVGVVLAEAVRVLAPDGVLVTTVDKQAAHGRAPLRATDHRPDVTRRLRSLGLAPVGETTFSGPSEWGSSGPGDPVFTLVAYARG